MSLAWEWIPPSCHILLPFSHNMFFPAQRNWNNLKQMSLRPTEPKDIQQLHLRPCNATQGQVSVRCKATTIHSSSSNISHLRFLLDECWMGISAASQLRIHNQSSTAYSKIGISPFMQFQKKTPTLRATNKQQLELKNNPSSCQMGPRQSEWPLAEKGATGCSGVWIRWSFMPRFYVSICKVHSPQFGS